MAVKEKEKDGDVTGVSSNGDIMKEEKDVVVDGESKETEDAKEREEEANEEVENALNGNEGSDKDTEEEVKAKAGTNKQKRGASKIKEKEKKEKENIKDAKKEIKSMGVKKGKEPGTPAAVTIERPTRERKSVERFVISNEKDSPKEFLIEKGRGTQLKDIPNVAYKLSKRRADDVLKMLHAIFYGRRVKNFQIKSNVSQFSGFVWGDNEEKQKIKMKEKLDKCFKSRLLEFCELLDMPAKINDRKEDLVAKLLEFMEAPHATTDVLLSEKEKSSEGKIQKRVVGRSSGKSPISSGRRLKQQKDEDSAKARRKRKLAEVKKDDHSDENEEMEDEEEQEDEQEEQEGDALEESDESDQEDPEELAEDEDVKKSKSAKKGSKKFPEKAAATKARKSKNATTSKLLKISSKHAKAEENSSSKAKVFSRKKSDSKKEDKSSTPLKRKRDDKGEQKASAPKKAKKSDDKKDEKEKPSTSRSPLPNGKTGEKISKAKGGADKKDRAGPSKEELRKAICDILKEVDFNTATFTDILKQLATHFKTDLMLRKAEVKSIIQEELTKLADDDDDDEDDDDEEGDGDKEDE